MDGQSVGGIIRSAATSRSNARASTTSTSPLTGCGPTGGIGTRLRVPERQAQSGATVTTTTSSSRSGHPVGWLTGRAAT